MGRARKEAERQLMQDRNVTPGQYKQEGLITDGVYDPATMDVSPSYPLQDASNTRPDIADLIKRRKI